MESWKWDTKRVEGIGILEHWKLQFSWFCRLRFHNGELEVGY